MKRKLWKRVAVGSLAAFLIGSMLVNAGSLGVLAESTTTAQAADSQEDGNVNQEGVCDVSSFDEFVSALADDSVFSINLTADITLTELVNIKRNVIIDGKGHIMIGSGEHRGFEIDSGVTTTIRNATITEINAGHYYSGVFYNCGTLTVEDCILKNNTCTYSAAILESKSNSIQVFRNCQILNNEANGEGSVFQNYMSSSELTIEGCIIAGNKNNRSGGSGGAICFRSYGGDITLNGCIISDNSNSDFSTYSDNGLGDEVQIKNCVFGTVYNDCTEIIENATQNGSTQVEGLSILDEDGSLKETDATGEAIAKGYSLIWSDDCSACAVREMKVYQTGIMTEDYKCEVIAQDFEATAEKCGGTTYTATATVDGTEFTDTKEVIKHHYSLQHYEKGETVLLPITAQKCLRYGKTAGCYYCPSCSKYFRDAECKKEIASERLFQSEEESLIYTFYLEWNQLYFFIPPAADTYTIPSEIDGHTVKRVICNIGGLEQLDIQIKHLIFPESVEYIDWYDHGSLESVTIYNRNAEIYSLGRQSANLDFYGYTGSTTEAYVNERNTHYDPNYDPNYDPDYKPDPEAVNFLIHFHALDADRVVIKEVSATLDGDIGMNYYLTFPQDISSNSGVYAELAVNGRSTKVRLADMTPEDDGSYKFTCWLNAKEMHDNVTFSLYDENDSPINIYTNGGNEIDSFNYSLAEYLNKLSSVLSADERLVNLANATLAYGSYAQKAFSYRVDTASSTSDLSNIAAESLVEHKMQKEGDIPEGLTLSEMTLILETKTTLRLYFKADDISKYSFMLDSAEAVPIEIPDERLYYIEVPDISAKDLDDVHTLQIGDCTLKFNALSYAYSILNENKNDKLCSAVKALYKYNTAANAYFGE